MPTTYILPAYLTATLCGFFIVLSLFLFMFKKRTKAKDSLTFAVFCLINIFLMYLDKRTLVIISYSIMSGLMLLTGVSMLLFKTIPVVYGIVGIKKVDVKSKTYNRDIVKFLIMFLLNLMLLASILI